MQEMREMSESACKPPFHEKSPKNSTRKHGTFGIHRVAMCLHASFATPSGITSRPDQVNLAFFAARFAFHSSSRLRIRWWPDSPESYSVAAHLWPDRYGQAIAVAAAPVTSGRRRFSSE